MKDLHDESVQYLKGVGPARKAIFANLGIENVEDLLYFFPRRYEDRRKMTTISQVKEGEWHTVAGEVLTDNSRRAWYTKKHVSQIEIADDTGKLTGVWFNQPYIGQYLKVGSQVVLYGKVERYKEQLQMIAPEYEIIDSDEDEALSIGRIVPVYPLTRGFTQRYLRRVIKTCLDNCAGSVKEVIPYNVRTKYNFQNLVKSFNNLHFPESFEAQKEAYRRVAFEEFFLFQVSVALRRLSITHQDGVVHVIEKNFCAKFEKAFSFNLTGAQKKVISEIAVDMQSGSPMHRLLQGDVGSGKTLVAFFGCVVAKHNGFQSAVMAPTEILAKQHFDVFTELVGAGMFKNIRLALLTSNVTAKEKEKIYRELKEDKIDLLVGTHALLSENVEFKKLSFVVIDEQHKFGVRQRALLPGKGTSPDTLIMTATPIPRTLCLTLYGDLDVSTIDELPAGRGAIRTLHFVEDSAPEVYKMIRERAQCGEQVYVVYPIIDESEKIDVKAATEMYEQFQKKEFPDLKVGLVHGQMKKKAAQAVMEDFKNKKIDILVSTTILEVGVDVPNATLMVIEHADRFGLSQLHQLRGRIGRGAKDSVCVLLADPTTTDGKARIDALLSTIDGFKIAEQDLLIRGAGEFFGRHQHGINELKITNPVAQIDILNLARQDAAELTSVDPKLESPANRPIRQTIERRYPTYLALVRAG